MVTRPARLFRPPRGPDRHSPANVANQQDREAHCRLQRGLAFCAVSQFALVQSSRIFCAANDSVTVASRSIEPLSSLPKSSPSEALGSQPGSQEKHQAGRVGVAVEIEVIMYGLAQDGRG